MTMKIHAGYEISYDCLQPTPMILTLSVHPSRRLTLLTPDRMLLDPLVPTREYCDGFGNICHVIRAPAGRLTISADFLVQDSGEKDEVAPDATLRPLETLPVETLVYLLGSRYCETDRLSNIAWSMFGKIPQGWTLVQVIVDYVHEHVTFGYPHASATRAAFDTFTEGKGVPRLRPSRRDALPLYEHSGPLLHRLSRRHRRASRPAPMDFSAWFEAYLGDRWYTFDARHNEPRIGRILIARGRDATDVAIVTSYDPHALAGFKVITDEVALN
jgi:transglutaminase-like putative cysteine protease